MNIQDTSPDYTRFYSDWKTIKDCLAGETTIKNNTTEYLPFPVALDDAVRGTKEFQSQYSIYLDGGVFVNYTSQSVEDLTAGIFKREPISDELPKDLEYMNINGIAKELASLVTAYGRGFVLTDYPKTGSVVTRAQELDDNIHAFFVTYEPTDILSWETSRIGGENILTRIVLREVREVEEEDTLVEKEFFRLLEMVEGVYTVTVYNDADTIEEEAFTPMANGKTLNHITGTFIGVVSNTAEIDKSPVIGIAQSNVKHYQTWAELNHVQVYMGHPTLSIVGAPNGFIKSAKENGVRIGIGASNALVIEGEGGDAKILEINGANIIHFKTLEKLEDSMVNQGARLRTHDKSGANDSGTALNIKASADSSTMASIAVQVELAIEQSLMFASEYMGVELKDWSYTLNKKFVTEKLDATVVRELSALVNAGQIPMEVLHNYLKSVDILKVEDTTDMLLAKVVEQNPVTAPFNNPTIEV